MSLSKAERSPAVRAEPVESRATPNPFGLSLSKPGLARWFGWRACFEGGGRDSPRRARYLFFASPKKSTQKKGDPAICDPCGANLRRGVCGVRRITHFAAAQLRSDKRGESDNEACALRRACHPATTPPQAQPDGAGQPKHPNSPTGLRCARPGLRSARRLRPRTRGRAKRWPVWMSGCGFPSGCAEERSGQRIRARDCLSEASSSETPLDASTGGCPQRSEGTQPVGSLFLGLLSFGEAKESESPAGAKSRPPP